MSLLELAKAVEARLRGTEPVDERSERNEKTPGASQGPAAPLSPEADGGLARLLALPLDLFARAGHCLEVRVPWWPEPLWFVPTAAAAEALVAEGINPSQIWTAAGLKDLLDLDPTPEQVRTIGLARLHFDGDILAVHPSPDADPPGGGDPTPS